MEVLISLFAMQTNGAFPQVLLRAIHGALVLSVLLCLGRLGIIFFLSLYGSAYYALGVLISLPIFILISLPIMLLVRVPWAPGRYLGLALAFIYIMINLACFHYEAMFGRLPGTSLLYYASELTHLAPSLDSNIPFPALVIEATLLLLLWLGFWPQTTKAVGGAGKLIGVVFGLVLLSQLAVPALPAQAYWAAKQPMVWIGREALAANAIPDEVSTLDKADIWRLQRLLGHTLPQGSGEPDAPMCRTPSTQPTIPSGRSVILLILEGVGEKEMAQVEDGKSVMPALAQFAANNLHFQNAYAPGSKTAQALVSVLTGALPQPIRNVLWKEPQPLMQSFVTSFRESGYQTGFFHGGDLSFENQRLFLQRSGFSTIDEYEPSARYISYGWGYDDGVVLKRTRQWIESQQATPYLATVFSLSTHDPYVLPENWSPIFSDSKRSIKSVMNWEISGGQNTRLAMLDSYRFLDDQLAEFFAWYETQERDRGTVLVIAGDHTPHYWNEAHDGKVRQMTFAVPVIIAGNEIVSAGNNADLESRLASLIDLPSTISGIVGLPPTPCDQGLNLLSSSWPEDRWVYAVGGNSLERVYAWNQQGQVMLDRVEGRIELLDNESVENTSATANGARLAEAREFFALVMQANHYLDSTGAYAPVSPMSVAKVKRPLPTVTNPIFVSHRGNLAGTRPKGEENSRLALQEVVDSAFEWVEVDFQLTSDEAVVALHDDYLNVSGERIAVNDLSLAEIRRLPGLEATLTLEEVLADFGDKTHLLIEAKPPIANRPWQVSGFGQKIAAAIQKFKLNDRVIVDSFSPMLAAVIKRHCDCAVGVDAPFRVSLKAPYLQWLADSGFDWVYIHHSVVDDETIELAHQHDLKVMAYTVNDPGVVLRWQGNYPDGIITDTESLIFNSRTNARTQ
ncbi:MAG: glycerophosphoryl diester phosphodiesterase [Litorivivens sp.]|jgi:glycerophosphoryl diester phosphodiesterase